MTTTATEYGRTKHAATHGTKPIEQLADRAAALADFDTAPLEIENVEILRITHEMAAHAATDVLPPALHPTFPPVVSWTIMEAPDSPWGPFRLAQTRVSCRSGTHPRALLIGAVTDNPQAAQALEARWAFRIRHGHINLQLRYDETRATITIDNQDILQVSATNPRLLRPQDIHWIASMHYATTPRGHRLVQFDPTYHVNRAELLTPHLHHYNPQAWGEPLVQPTHPISADKTHATITLPTIRYICHPDQPAFTGTETLV